MVSGTPVCSQTGPVPIHDEHIFATRRKFRIEAGFPPYKMPKKTWPVCVQDLSWPRMWKNAHFWLNENPPCIRGDKHELLDEPGYTSCCTEQYSTQHDAVALESPYYLKQVGGEVVPDGRDYDPDHTYIKSHEKTMESFHQAMHEPKDISANLNFFGSSIENPFERADASIFHVAPQAEEISGLNIDVEDEEQRKGLLSQNLLNKGVPSLSDFFRQAAQISNENVGVESGYRENIVEENEVAGQNTIADVHVEPQSDTNGVLEVNVIDIGLATARRRAKRHRLD